MKKLLLGFLLLLPMVALAQVAPAWRPYIEIKPDEARVAVLKAMSQNINDYTRSVIVGALMDPYRPVVDTAKGILRDNHCPATFHALVAGMVKGSQYEAALLLADYKEPRYIRLMGKLLHHERIEVRRPVALAMGLSESRLAIKPLERAVADPDPHVRQEVALALQRLGEPAQATR